MSPDLLEDDVAGLLSAAVDRSDGDVTVVNPARASISTIVTSLAETSDHPKVRVLADEQLLKEVLEDFIVASRAADLVADGSLDVRVLESDPHSSLFVSTESVISLVYADGDVAGLRTDEAPFVDRIREHYDDRWTDAERFSLRTPPLSEVRETLAAEIGEDTAADFDAMLEAVEVARGNGDGLDEVTISLLVAARNKELLYDISRWGEDVGLASKATFSRTKTTLEDGGLVDTEKVPIDVGRPRLRLTLGDDRLREADVEEVPKIAQRLLD